LEQPASSVPRIPSNLVGLSPEGIVNLIYETSGDHGAKRMVMSLMRSFRKLFRHRNFEMVMEANLKRPVPIDLSEAEWREIHMICFWGKCVYDKDGIERVRFDKPDDPRIELLSNIVSKFNRKHIIQFFEVPIFRTAFLKSYRHIRAEVQFTNNPKMGKGDVVAISADQYNQFKERLFTIGVQMNLD